MFKCYVKYQDTECKKRKKVNVLKKKTKFLKSSGERKACEESEGERNEDRRRKRVEGRGRREERGKKGAGGRLTSVKTGAQGAGSERANGRRET